MGEENFVKCLECQDKDNRVGGLHTGQSLNAPTWSRDKNPEACRVGKLRDVGPIG